MKPFTSGSPARSELMETEQLLRWSEELLARAEPKLRQRDEKFLDEDGKFLFEQLRNCDHDLVRIGARRTHRSVAWAIDEIKHRRRAKGN